MKCVQLENFETIFFCLTSKKNNQDETYQRRLFIFIAVVIVNADPIPVANAGVAGGLGGTLDGALTDVGALLGGEGEAGGKGESKLGKLGLLAAAFGH